jgi:hypothetical protein
MSRIKQTACKSSGPPQFQFRKVEDVKERSMLLQLMGLPKEGDSCALTAPADWPAVVEHLSSHSEEAAIKDLLRTILFEIQDDDVSSWRILRSIYGPCQRKDALDERSLGSLLVAFPDIIMAFPDIVNKPRSVVTIAASMNAVLCNEHPTIIDTLRQASPTHLCGLQRTRTFEITGFSPLCNGPSPRYDDSFGGGFEVDWQSLEDRLRSAGHANSLGFIAFLCWLLSTKYSESSTDTGGLSAVSMPATGLVSLWHSHMHKLGSVFEDSSSSSNSSITWLAFFFYSCKDSAFFVCRALAGLLL